MLRSDEQWLNLADSFYGAALDADRWYPALEGLATATGSRSGQLITIGPDAVVPINIMTNLDPEALDQFVACRGGDPEINPRVNAGMHAPVLKVLAENDFLTVDEHARHPHYDEFARPWDIPFICLATLERHENLLIGLAVLRSQAQGHITAEQRAVFASLAPHVRAAVRMQIALEGNGAALVRGTLETLTVPAFVCDRAGRVLELTSRAEELLRGQSGLSLRNRRLSAALEIDDKVLNEAIALAARGAHKPGAPLSQTVVVRTEHAGRAPLVLDVLPLPSTKLALTSQPKVLVVARGPRADTRKATILQSVYGLTSAETEIALQLAQGASTESIAHARDVAVGTVRAQIKSALAKLGVRRQVELVARLHGF